MAVPTPTVQAPGPVASHTGGARRGAPTAVPRHRLRRVAAMMAVFNKFTSNQPTPVLRQRQLVADLCRLLGAGLGQPTGSRPPRGMGPAGIGLPPAVALDDLGLSLRMRQTLEGLLAGEAEKQIAYRLHLSPHTVHVYVKGLYRHFGVSSRGELLARFVRPSSAAG